MKKLFGCVLSLFAAAVAYADGNNISMVTYFPVPYVAYNRVQAAQQMDIGLTANGGQLSLGTATSSTAPLTAGTTRVTGGMLNLTFNNAVTENNRYISLTQSSNPLSLGVGQDAANLNFANLRIGTVSTSATDGARPGSGISSINTNELVVDGLQLFGKDFPSCAAVNADSSGNGQIAWKKLALGTDNKQEIYLTCGATKTCPADMPLPKQCEISDLVSVWDPGSAIYKPAGSFVNEGFLSLIDLGRLSDAELPRAWTRLSSWVGVGEQDVCGWKVRTRKCCLDQTDGSACAGQTGLPKWVNIGWDKSGCHGYYPTVKKYITCNSHFNRTDLTGMVTVTGQQTCDRNGLISDVAITDYDTSECKGVTYEWGDEEFVSTGTEYVDPTSYYDQVVWSLQHPSSSGMYINGGHSACWHIRTCDEGYSEASCSSSSDVGTTRQHVKGVSTGTSTRCQVWRHRYYTGPNGQQMDNPWHDSAADFNATVRSCNTYRETCKKTCRKINVASNGTISFGEVTSCGTLHLRLNL